MRSQSRTLAKPRKEEQLQIFEAEDFDLAEDSESHALLGKGAFAAVYLARCKRDRKLYALKVVG